ncbi:MAG TPA: hypothetical protein DCR43_04135 [Bacteroidales bacterium]|nr:hypothetical protein [Bacteroidales bacterium]HBZ65906.1 hypothetical protein [Bacteroidales bacterium]
MFSVFQRMVLVFILSTTIVQVGRGQLQVTTGHGAEELLQMLLGQGVVVSNVTSVGLIATENPEVWQAGKFFNGIVAGIGIDSGLLLTSGDALLAIGPNNNGGDGIPTLNGGDLDLGAIIGTITEDACILEFDFVPMYDTIAFRYSFASEEYNDFVNGGVNDVFAFFITGPNPSGGTYDKFNIAIIPKTSVPVSINTLNNGNNSAGSPNCRGNGPCEYCQYYVDNCIYGSPIEYDGYTTVLTAMAVVVPCQSYHLKIAIADGGDEVYDSGVFLEAGSFSSPGVALEPVYSTPGGAPFAVEGCTQADLKVTLPFALPATSWVVFDSITGSATNGVDYNLINDSVMFLPNQLTVTIPIIPVYDAQTEGDENIYIYLSNQVGCAGVNLQRTEILLHDFIPVEIGSDTAVCEGTQVTFNVGEVYKSYTWHDGTHGQTWTSSGLPPGGQVSIAVEDSWGCTSSDTLQLTVHERPVVNPIRHD